MGEKTKQGTKIKVTVDGGMVVDIVTEGPVPTPVTVEVVDEDVRKDGGCGEFVYEFPAGG